MILELVNKLYFTIFVLSILVFIDAVIKIKKPLLLKINFLTIIALLGLISFTYLHLTSMIKLLIIVLSKGFIFLSILNIFTILYFPNLKKWIYFLTFTFIIFVALIFNYLIHNSLLYQHLNSTSIFPIWSIKHNWPIYLSIFRATYVFLLFSTLGYYCYSILFRFHHQNVYFDKIKNWSISILIFTIYLFILYLPLTFLNFKDTFVYFNSILTHFAFLLIIFYRPVFLNKSSFKILFGESFKKENDQYISELDFINLFYTKEYFLKNNASLEDFATIMNVSSNDLYKFIYFNYSTTFNDLINKNRVEYFINILQNTKYNNFTIDALAKEAGFSSRQHLYKPFKKFHGGNPSDLLETIA